MTTGSGKRRSHWPISILSSAAALVNLLLPLILVRLLTPHDVGLFKVFFLYVVIVPGFALTAGLMSGLGYWAGKGERGAEAIQVSAMIVLAAAVLFATVGLASFPVFERVFGWNETTALAFAAALFGSIAGSFFEEAAISRGRIWAGALFYAGFEIVRTVAIIGAAFAFRSLEAVFLTHAALITLKAIAGYWWGYRLGIVRFHPRSEIVRAVVGYAFPVSMAWVFGIFVGYTDQLILSTWISPSEFAFYSIGCLSVAPLLIIEQSITRVLIPELSRAFSDGRTADAARLYQDAVRHLGFVMIPAAVGLVVFAEPIIRILFTAAYAPAIPYLRIFALTYLCLMVPHDAIARARGNAGWILKNFALFSFPTLALTLCGVVIGGARGALIGMVISKVALRLYAAFYVHSTTQWRLRDFLPLGGLVRMGMFAAFLGLMMWGMRGEFSSSIEWFLVCGAIFSILYLPGAFLMQGQAAIPRRGGRVLVVTQKLSIGGLEKMVLNLCTHLKAGTAWEVHVLAYDHGPRDDRGFLPEFSARDIPVELYKKGRGFSLPVVWKIVRRISRDRVTVIHTHDLGGLMYGVAAKAAVGGRVRIIHTQHSFLHLAVQPKYALYERIFARFADEITVVSADTRAQYHDLGIPAERLHLVENGVHFAAEPMLELSARIARRRELLPRIAADIQGSTWIVYVARLHPGKGQDRAVDLWRRLRPEVRHSSALVLVGPEAYPGERGRIEALIHAAPDNERIILAGESSAPEQWLEAGDIYLSCSEFEGMPLGPLEAVGAGLPTVLSAIPGHEFLRPLSAQFPLDDAAAGAAALSDMIAAVKERGERYRAETWAKSAWVRDQFSVASMGARYEALYSSQFQEASTA